MPEVRRGQRKRRTGPDQPDFGARGLRRGVSAQGRSPRRKQRQRRLCRREPPAAHNRWQSAALAGFAAAGTGAVLSGSPVAPVRLRGFIQCSDFQCSDFQRSDFQCPYLIDRTGRQSGGRRHRSAARERARVERASRAGGVSRAVSGPAASCDTGAAPASAAWPGLPCCSVQPRAARYPATGRSASS